MICELVYCLLLHVRIFLNCALPRQKLIEPSTVFFFHLLIKSSNQISIDTASEKESLKVIQLTKYKGDERAKVLPP